MADIVESIRKDAEKTGGPFHPSKIDLGDGSDFSFTGLSLRDWFAGQALTGLLSLEDWADVRNAAKHSYSVADAMLKARKGEL